MYVKTNVSRPSKIGAGTRESKDPNIVIVQTEGILTSPSRDGKGVKYDGNFVFKSGEYAIKVYATASSIKQNKTLEGDEDAVGVNAGVEFAHPGDELEINECIQGHINVPVMIFILTDACGGGTPFYKVYGTPCAPLTLKSEGQNDNDATKNLMKFEPSAKSQYVPGFYEGTLTFDTVKATVAQDAATVDVTNGPGEYQLTDGSAAPIAITDIVNGSHGDVITLLGSGGTYPSTIAASEAKFEMRDAVDYTALAGSAITFKAYKNGATTSDIIWLEQSRS